MMGTQIDFVLGLYQIAVCNLYVWSVPSNLPLHSRSLSNGFYQVKREVPTGILEIVSARLKTATSQDHYPLSVMLEAFLWRAERNCEALEVLDAVIGRYPDDVRGPLNKAVRLLCLLDDLEGALKSLDVALERACGSGFYRREALNNKARIVLKFGRGEELSRLLEEIVSLKITKGIPDIGRERDFVDRAPPGMIPPDILARYNEFRPKRPTDTGADELPEWEPPDDAE